MEFLMGILPIDIYILKVAVNSYLRMVNNGNQITKQGEIIDKLAHGKIVMTASNEIKELHMPTD